MPNPILDDDLDDDDVNADGTADDESPNALRRAAKAGKAAKAEADRLSREIAFLKAGIDTDSPVGTMFAKAYDGELTKEAVTAAFAALGVPAVQTPAADADADSDAGAGDDADDGLTDADRASTRERSALANGSVNDSAANSNPDPTVEARKIADSVIENGGTQDDSLAAMFHSIASAAIGGDKRVIVARG